MTIIENNKEKKVLVSESGEKKKHTTVIRISKRA